MPHWICGFVMRSVITENGSGGSSPGCISTADQSIVVPSRRGGAGLEPPKSEAGALEGGRKTHCGGLSDPTGGPVLLAEMDQTAEKGAGGDDDGPCPKLPAIGQAQSGDPTIDHDQLVGLTFDDGQTLSRCNRGLHCGGIELPVGLGPRATHSGTLPAVQDTKLDAAGITDPAHQTIEGIDFADQMALAETADRGIAGHRTDGREAMSDQRGSRTHSGRRGSGFTAGVAAANHDDIEALSLCSHGRTSSSEAGKLEVETGKEVFHVKRSGRGKAILRKQPHAQ